MKYKISDETIVQAAKDNKTMSEAARAIKMSFMAFRYRAIKLGVYEPNQGRLGVVRGSDEIQRLRRKEIPLSEILNGNHPNYLTSRLKTRIIKAGLKEEKCECCGVGNLWNGKKLVLHLDHKDGDSKNHKLDNIQLLCPNCHSQTETYAGRNNEKYFGDEKRIQANKRCREYRRMKRMAPC